MLWLAATLYAIVFFTAFAVGPLLTKLDQ